MRCPTCTDEMEKTRPTFYLCHGCKWKGQIMSESDIMKCMEITQKFQHEPHRIPEEIEKEFSRIDTGV